MVGAVIRQREHGESSGSQIVDLADRRGRRSDHDGNVRRLSGENVNVALAAIYAVSPSCGEPRYHFERILLDVAGNQVGDIEAAVDNRELIFAADWSPLRHHIEV